MLGRRGWGMADLRDARGLRPADGRSRGDELPEAKGVELRKMMIDGSEIYLCARGGGGARVPSITRAAAGCRRILGGEA